MDFQIRKLVLALALFGAPGCSLSLVPSSEAELLAKTDRLLAAGERKEAEHLFQRAIEANQTWHLAAVKFAALLISEQRAGAAVPLLEGVLAQAPSAEGHYQLGLARHDLGLDAKSAFDAAVRLDPQHLGALTALGALEEEAGKLDRAKLAWEEVARIDPTYAPAQANLGRLMARKRQYERAEQYYLAAVNASPGYGKAVAGLGLVYRAQGRDEAALGVWQRALERRETAVEVLPFLTELLNESGRSAEALSHIEKLLASAPPTPEPYLLLIKQQQLAGVEPQRSLEVLLQGVERFPESAELHVALGKQFIASGRAEEAERVLRTAIRLKPDSSEPAALIGALMVGTGRFKEALPLYEALCNSEAATGESHLILGGIYSALERPDEALAEWNRAVALDPQLADGHLQLARAYAERHDRERSLKSYKRFLYLAEKNPTKVEVPEGIQEEIMRVSTGAP